MNGSMRYLWRTRLFPAVTVAVLSATLANAKVASTTLAELTDDSRQIIVGTVISLHQVVGHRVAEVEVHRVVKGRPDIPRLFILAEPTWTCDISEAKKGETVLLFLAPGDEFKASRPFWNALDRLRQEAPFFKIHWAGRGRMPLREVDGAEFVTLWTDDVRLPEHIATIDGPEPENISFIRSVRLADILTAVDIQLAEAP